MYDPIEQAIDKQLGDHWLRGTRVRQEDGAFSEFGIFEFVEDVAYDPVLLIEDAIDWKYHPWERFCEDLNGRRNGGNGHNGTNKSWNSKKKKTPSNGD